MPGVAAMFIPVNVFSRLYEDYNRMINQILKFWKTWKHIQIVASIPARWYIYGKNSDTRCFAVAARDNTDGDQKTASQR